MLILQKILVLSDKALSVLFSKIKNGLLWVGTKGSGIYTFNSVGNKGELTTVQNLTIADGLLSNSVFTISQGQGNEYWIGTDGRGINYYDTQSKKIYTLFVNESSQREINLSSVYSNFTDRTKHSLGRNKWLRNV